MINIIQDQAFDDIIDALYQESRISRTPSAAWNILEIKFLVMLSRTDSILIGLFQMPKHSWLLTVWSKLHHHFKSVCVES